jgi:hypothetical protein
MTQLYDARLAGMVVRAWPPSVRHGRASVAALNAADEYVPPSPPSARDAWRVLSGGRRRRRQTQLSPAVGEVLQRRAASG